LYANFENEEEPVTLSITAADPLAGTGVFKATITGPNGSNIYYQIGK
jgi:hypothetical protein